MLCITQYQLVNVDSLPSSSQYLVFPIIHDTIFRFYVFFLQKIIMQKVKRTYLHMHLGSSPDWVDSEIFFFLHNTETPVPVPSTPEEAEQTLPLVFEFGIFDAPPLFTLEEVLGNVYNMLLSYNSHKNESYEGMSETDIITQQKALEKQNKLFVRDDFLISLQKFGLTINRTIKQIEGDIKLDIAPMVMNLTESSKYYAKDRSVVMKLEEILYSWEKTVASASEQVLRRTAQGNGPLGEVDFWRERNATLSALYEQLNLPVVKKVADILTDAQSDSLAGYDYHK